MTIFEALERGRGVARFADLGVSRYLLRQHLDAGDVVRVGRGWYALPSAPPALVAAVRQGAKLSCVSAVRLRGVPVPGDEGIVHCSIPDHRGSNHRGRRRQTAVVVHRESDLDSAGPPIVPANVALARAMRCLAYPDAVAVLDLGCDHRLDLLAQVLARVKRRSPGLATSLATDVDLASRSIQETHVRLALRAAGLHVVAGAVVPGVGEVDLLVEGVLVIEIDGFAYHSGRKEYRNDRRRDRRAVELGLTVIRYAFEDVDPAAIVRRAVGLVDALRRSPRVAVATLSAAEREAMERLAVAALLPTTRRASRRLRQLGRS